MAPNSNLKNTRKAPLSLATILEHVLRIALWVAFASTIAAGISCAMFGARYNTFFQISSITAVACWLSSFVISTMLGTFKSTAIRIIMATLAIIGSFIIGLLAVMMIDESVHPTS